ncbi:hypothetical protein ACFPM1_14835 [Halorubrum rubrum]|uniref:Sulfate ABC transporter permease n=1 Tax=Halorubrum rubrum TaxID=1126240 RepID=A0ABD5R569_9EURY|nr:hypothetical protein [Halorubrum rubrum]
MSGENGDGAIEGDVVDDTDVAGETRLARRWRSLDRGWQALCLGLAIVAIHLVVYPV